MRKLSALLAGALLFAGGARAAAEGLLAQPTPFSVWLDFDRLGSTQSAGPSYPIWLESVNLEPDGPKEQTVFRLRLRHLGELSRELQLRVFFDDLPGSAPVVTGWTETGMQRWSSGPLGSGLGLASSETLFVPAEALDYLDLTVPGKGRTVRGVFVSSVKRTETRFALDFARPAGFAEPFGNLASAAPPAMAADEPDSFLLGRVKALLEAGPLKITPLRPARWTFQLDRVPRIAVINLEILDADLEHPPEVTLNGQALGPVSLQLPDLADPAFQGEVIADRHYRYNGWLRAQVLAPTDGLLEGENNLELDVNPRSSAVAIRAVELQLKFPTP